jgi:hypothetical protein
MDSPEINVLTLPRLSVSGVGVPCPVEPAFKGLDQPPALAGLDQTVAYDATNIETNPTKASE